MAENLRLHIKIINSTFLGQPYDVIKKPQLLEYSIPFLMFCFLRNFCGTDMRRRDVGNRGKYVSRGV